ncbi:MAG: hypothetical protein OHK93_000714 [Ramalina farinacea]|uniref:Developmental regulatory protein wetA n=1 Tax=Ramalina farinacea TaxID=258253 RepID=A0AA43QIL8_9LECA|nr:hypothetical protein [Ramalina farinacea]
MNSNMMSFDYFSSTNKGFSYQSEKNEPSELFDTHVKHDSIPFVLNCSGELTQSLEDLIDFDFHDDGTAAATSHSLTAESDNNHFTNSCAAQQNQSLDWPTRSPQRSTALRPHRAFPRRDIVNPSISGQDLSNLEGKINHKDEQLPSSSSRAHQETKSLRRKGKFNTVRNAPDPVPGKSVRRIRKVASNDMMRLSSHHPSHHKRGTTNMPVMNDWTSRLDQLSLQQTGASLRNDEDFYSPSASTVTPGDVLHSPYNMQSPPLTPSLGHRKTVSEQVLPRQKFQSPHHGMQSPFQAPRNNFELFMQQSQQQQQQQQQQQRSPNPAANMGGSNGLFPSSPGDHHALRHQASTPSSRHSRQAASWAPRPLQQPTGMNYGIVSPSQLHTNWEDTLHENNEDAYFNNASMADPPHTAPLPDFPTPDFNMNYTNPPFTPFVDETINGLPTPTTNSSFAFTPTTSSMAPNEPPQGYQPFHMHQSYPTNTSTVLTSPTTLPSHCTHTSPPSRASSSSSPPAALPPPSNTPPSNFPPARSTRLSTSKRRSKIGSLRLPKSASSLSSSRHHKSHSPPLPHTPTHRPPLRTPKSASALTSSSHHKSTSRSSAHLKSPHDSSGGGGFGFVNFTPQDKSKILTGVAPSGSSKTKARREMEANEKKRRLSLAAEKAVREAGGDWEGVRGVVGL